MTQGIIDYVCPSCAGPLDRLGQDGEWRCLSCQKSFPVHIGVPILIDDQFSYFRQADILAAALERSEATRRSLAERVRGAVSRPGHALKSAVLGVASTSPTIYSRSRQVEVGRVMLAYLQTANGEASRSGHDDSPVMLVVGGGTVGTIASVFRASGLLRMVSSDVYWTPATDFVSDTKHLPLKDSSVDCVLAEGVLEHVLRPALAIAEIHRVLKPGGLLFLTTPLLLGVHMETMDYQRWTKLGLIDLAREFEPLECAPIEGPLVALAYQISYVAMAASPRRLVPLTKQLVNFVVGWLKYLDPVLRRNGIGEDAASSLYFVGRKSEHTLSDTEVNGHFSGVGVCPK
ncbi:MAG TPA: methyltransferase domain-containing protein [Solirubrobacteraceae bacterium]|nr:methyltransferase domain-containing protein [Solirubrobacteraceae bacterium]